MHRYCLTSVTPGSDNLCVRYRCRIKHPVLLSDVIYEISARTRRLIYQEPSKRIKLTRINWLSKAILLGIYSVTVYKHSSRAEKCSTPGVDATTGNPPNQIPLSAEGEKVETRHQNGVFPHMAIEFDLKRDVFKTWVSSNFFQSTTEQLFVQLRLQLKVPILLTSFLVRLINERSQLNLHTHNSEPMHSTILGGIVASLALFAAPVVARGRYAGGIDMNEACRHQYGEGTWAFSDGNSAYDWHCTSGPHSEWVDTNGYCGWKYGCGAQSDAQGGGLNDWACYCAT
ncbi:hypothetical protein IQ06DRAFT_299207 [Phaeosphaeriaceae sp. SRC1lsM3a]|nr:hypothetical protein IQ06DRAFT_299207 [Stagonospora sp. SRC1lsM3a]